jgi:hypothetical protein
MAPITMGHDIMRLTHIREEEMTIATRAGVIEVGQEEEVVVMGVVKGIQIEVADMRTIIDTKVIPEDKNTTKGIGIGIDATARRDDQKLRGLVIVPQVQCDNEKARSHANSCKGYSFREIDVH